MMKKNLIGLVSIALLLGQIGCGSRKTQQANKESVLHETVVEQKELKSEELGSVNYKISPNASRVHSFARPAGIAPAIPYSTDSYTENDDWEEKPVDHNTEEYKRIYENSFVSPLDDALSTFSIDVDAASYANVRRFLNQNQIPYPDAVRTEEMINYFDYTYPEPVGKHPFSISMEMATCPWKPEHRLVQIGLKGKSLDLTKAPSSNLVFLIDVSGSMDEPNKLPLLKSAFRLLVNELRDQDRVAIVVYAGAAGIVLPSTPASEKSKILAALDKLEAGGSTAGGEGIQLAYEVAKQHFIKEGNNRVILATDGDFNVGVSSEGELVRLIEEKREAGVFLSILGFGMGNYKDAKLEQLADKGNGNYAYIDNILEAKKVLVGQMGGTLYTIAKDVKIQVEFNPAYVKGYRLIGYENRVMAAKDFNDDKKDAGELGSGHTVTALYEIVPPDAMTNIQRPDSLKYSSNKMVGISNGELLTVRFRYKAPQGETSELITQTLEAKHNSFDKASENLRFASSVAAYSMLLRRSQYKGNASYQNVKDWAKGALGKDEVGYRAEFLRLVEQTRLLDTNVQVENTAKKE